MDGVPGYFGRGNLGRPSVKKKEFYGVRLTTMATTPAGDPWGPLNNLMIMYGMNETDRIHARVNLKEKVFSVLQGDDDEKQKRLNLVCNAFMSTLSSMAVQQQHTQQVLNKHHIILEMCDREARVAEEIATNGGRLAVNGAISGLIPSTFNVTHWVDLLMQIFKFPIASEEDARARAHYLLGAYASKMCRIIQNALR